MCCASCMLVLVVSLLQCTSADDHLRKVCLRQLGCITLLDDDVR